MTALVITPHPMTTQGQRLLTYKEAFFVPTERLDALLARQGVLPGQQWRVSIGGIDVPEAQWGRVRPKHGHLIEACRVPEKGVLRLIAMVALAYLTFGAGLVVGGSTIGGIGFFGGSKILAGLAYMAGSMVINKLLGPKPISRNQSQNSASPTYSLGGGRNRARPFEPMALVLGEPYCVPDLASIPFSFFANGEQFLWQIFHAGINCSDVTDLRIGKTLITTYQGVSINREGFAVNNQGLPALNTNVDTVAGGVLDAPGGPGPAVTRTSSADTIVLAVDIDAMLYRVDNDSGAYANAQCNIEIVYRAVGSPTWLPFVAPNEIFTLENASAKPLRLTYQLQVPSGQYEVRCTKISPNLNSTSHQDSIQWSTLKSYQLDTGDYSGQARMAIQIQASGQLTGTLDEVNWRAVANPMPYWNGTDWVTATDRATGLCNPGAHILLLARGIYSPSGRRLAGLGLPDSRINIESLKRFMVFCKAKGFEFDYFLQETTSIGDLMDAIAAAGMGSIGWPDGKLGVVWFTDDEPVTGVINMANIKVKSFAVDYTTAETADEIEFQYFDRDRGNVWKSIRVLAPGVVTPSETARQQLVGVGNEAQAAVLARFSMAQNVYQRRTVSCDLDLEHMTFRRSQVVALSHDVTQWGYGGRLQGVVNNAGILTLTLDHLVPHISPGGATSRYIGLRIAGESTYRIFPVAAFVGPSRTITLAQAWPVGMGAPAVPGDVPATNPVHDCLWIYDFKATPGQKLRVADISPSPNMSGAKLALVTDSPEFWDYVWNGTYAPPPNDALIAVGPPVVTSTRITEELIAQANTFYVDLTLTFDITGSFASADLWGANGNGPLTRLGTTTKQSITWRGGLDEVWRLELRPRSFVRVGDVKEITYAVLGLREPPPFVEDLTWDGSAFRWRRRTAPADLAGVTARFNYGSNRDWGLATPLDDGVVITENPWTPKVLPSGPITVMFKHLDTTKNESVEAAHVYLNLGSTIVDNVVASRDFRALGWPGTLSGGALVGGDLEANNSQPFYGPPASVHYNPNPLAPYYTNNFDAMTWESTKWDVPTFAAGARLTLITGLAGSGYQVEYRRPGSASFYDPDPTAPHYSADPSAPYYPADPPYQVWPGEVLAQPGLYQFRLSTVAGSQQGVFGVFTAQIDVADKVVRNVLTPLTAGGVRIAAVAGLFSTIKGVRGDLRGTGVTATSWRIVDLDPALGPLIQPTIGGADGGVADFNADITGVPV